MTSQQADLDNDSYLKTLSRGGLFTPSRCLADFVCNSFAILEYLEHDIIAFEIPVAKAATYTLKRYGSVSNFTCETHRDWGFEFETKIIVNIFFNNKQKFKQNTQWEMTLFQLLKRDKGQRSKLITRTN